MVEENKNEEINSNSKVNEPIKIEKKEDSNKGNKITLIVILVVIIIITSVGYLEKDEIIKYYNQIQGKEQSVPYDNTKKDEETISSEVEGQEEQTEYEYKLYMIKDNDDYFVCEKVKPDCTYTATIKTENNNIEIIRTDKKNYVLYNDNNILKVYSVKEDKIYVSDITRSEYKGGYIEVDEKTGKLLGVSFFLNGTRYMEFYSFLNNKRIYENTYRTITFINDKYLSGTIEKDGIFSSVELVDINEGKVIKREINDSLSEDDYYSADFIQYNENGNDFYILIVYIGDHYEYKKIYNNNFDEIISFGNDTKLPCYVSFDNNQVYVVNDNMVYVYDNKGKLINKSIKYERIYKVAEKYIIAYDGHNLIITTLNRDDTIIRSWRYYDEYYEMSPYSETNIENGNVIVKIIDDSVSVDELWEKYKNDDLFKNKEELMDEMKFGSYFRFGYEYIFNPNTKEIKKEPTYIEVYK